MGQGSVLEVVLVAIAAGQLQEISNTTENGISIKVGQKFQNSHLNNLSLSPSLSSGHELSTWSMYPKRITTQTDKICVTKIIKAKGSLRFKKRQIHVNYTVPHLPIK